MHNKLGSNKQTFTTYKQIKQTMKFNMKLQFEQRQSVPIVNIINKQTFQ